MSLNGTNFKKEDFFTYNFHEVLKIPLSKVLEELDEFYKTSLFENAPPLKEARGGIAELKKKGKLLYIASGRPLHLKERTERYIENNLNGSFEEIHFADFHPFAV